MLWDSGDLGAWAWFTMKMVVVAYGLYWVFSRVVRRGFVMIRGRVGRSMRPPPRGEALQH